MNVSEFVKSLVIDPVKDIEPNFELSKVIEIDATNHKGCFNCNDTLNQENIKSTAWTSIQHCWWCNHLNVTYYSDRMSGSSIDTIRCFSNKQI